MYNTASYLTILLPGAVPGAPQDSDSGTGTDSGSLHAFFTGTDTGTASSESTIIGGDSTTTDSDANILVVETGLIVIFDQDTATATEAVSLHAVITDSDVGSGADTGVVPPIILAPNVDTATSSELGVLTPRTILAFGILNNKWFSEGNTKWGSYASNRWQSRLIQNGDQIS